MVSYRQLPSGQVVLHERETTSSGRPKPTLASEDEFFIYDQTRSGVVTSRPKSNLEHYAWWHKQNVKFDGKCRQTPLTEFEKQMGVRSCIPSFRYDWCIRPRYGCQKRTFNEEEWAEFKQTHTIDYGNLEIIYTSDRADYTGQGNSNWDKYFREKAGKLNLEVVSISGLVFREKQKPAVVEKTRPNPKEESIASVKIEKPEPIEIEPIKEVTKYSPLMIAGVIAVVVILLLKRRRA